MIPIAAYRRSLGPGDPGDPHFSNVVLLLPMELDPETQDENVFIDHSTYSHTVTQGSTAGPYLITTIKKFGLRSAAMNSGQYLSIPDHTAFSLGSSDFTLELWLYKLSSVNPTIGIFSQRTSSTSGHAFTFQYNTSSNWQFIYTTNGSTQVTLSGFTTDTLANITWYHIALVRNGSTLSLFIDGVKKTDKTLSATLFNSSAVFRVGMAAGNTATNGSRFDEVRLTIGVARYTSDFTPPTSAFPTRS